MDKLDHRPLQFITCIFQEIICTVNALQGIQIVPSRNMSLLNRNPSRLDNITNAFCAILPKNKRTFWQNRQKRLQFAHEN